MKNRNVFLVIALISSTVLGCSSDSGSTIATIDPGSSLRVQLQKLVDDAVESGLPGVSLHVQDRGESISVVAGVANRDTAEPVTPSSLFHAGSIGKTFVATMLLRLVDMGYLQLDDPIDLWLDPSMSSMIADSNRITIRMLLSHTSGIQDYFSNPDYGIAFAESPGKIWTPTENLGYIDNTQNNFEPGAEFSYSNTNYLLLGVIAERITGLSLGMALRQWVFDPAGLENTYGAYENLGQPEIAHGYLPISFLENSSLNIELPTDGSDLDTFEWLESEGLGDAPIQSTSGDLNSFIRTLIDTDTLISDELKTQMQTESFPGSSEHGFGLYILHNGFDNSLRFMHGGKSFGLISSMSYTPSEDSSFTMIANASFGDYDELFGDYINRLFLILERSRR